MSVEEEIRKLVLEQRRLEREIERVYQEVIFLERTLNEIKNATLTLDEMTRKKIVKGEILFPIGGGVFAFGSLLHEDKVLMNIGSNVYVTKTVGDALKILNSNYDVLSKAYSDRMKILNDLRKRYNEIAAILLEYQLARRGR